MEVSLSERTGAVSCRTHAANLATVRLRGAWRYGTAPALAAAHTPASVAFAGRGASPASCLARDALQLCHGHLCRFEPSDANRSRGQYASSACSLCRSPASFCACAEELRRHYPATYLSHPSLARSDVVGCRWLATDACRRHSSHTFPKAFASDGKRTDGCRPQQDFAAPACLLQGGMVHALACFRGFAAVNDPLGSKKSTQIS